MSNIHQLESIFCKVLNQEKKCKYCPKKKLYKHPKELLEHYYNIDPNLNFNKIDDKCAKRIYYYCPYCYQNEYIFCYKLCQIIGCCGKVICKSCNNIFLDEKLIKLYRNKSNNDIKLITDMDGVSFYKSTERKCIYCPEDNIINNPDELLKHYLILDKTTNLNTIDRTCSKLISYKCPNCSSNETIKCYKLCQIIGCCGKLKCKNCNEIYIDTNDILEYRKKLNDEATQELSNSLIKIESSGDAENDNDEDVENYNNNKNNNKFDINNNHINQFCKNLHEIVKDKSIVSKNKNNNISDEQVFFRGIAQSNNFEPESYEENNKCIIESYINEQAPEKYIPQSYIYYEEEDDEKKEDNTYKINSYNKLHHNNIIINNKEKKINECKYCIELKNKSIESSNLLKHYILFNQNLFFDKSNCNGNLSINCSNCHEINYIKCSEITYNISTSKGIDCIWCNEPLISMLDILNSRKLES